jgi:transcriptional regulator with XRE-family HTH domain
MATIRELREQNYISRRELADLSGVSESTIVRIEDGNNRTKREVAEKVLQALSGRIGQEITIDAIEGLNLYNVMRDRRQRTKSRKEPSAA